MRASSTCMPTREPNLKMQLCFLWLALVFLSSTTVQNSTSQEVMTHKTVSLYGNLWTPQVISIRSSRRSTPNAKSLPFGMRRGLKDTQPKTSMLSPEENSWLRLQILLTTKTTKSPTIPLLKARKYATFSILRLTAKLLVVVLACTY